MIASCDILLFCFPPKAVNNSLDISPFKILFPLQSHPEAERIPVWEQRPSCLLHPRWDLWSWWTAWPWQWPSRRVRPQGWPSPGLPGIRHPHETPAHRHPPAPAGSHPVCGCHHWEGGCHHPQYHQADTEQVSGHREPVSVYFYPVLHSFPILPPICLVLSLHFTAILIFFQCLSSLILLPCLPLTGLTSTARRTLVQPRSQSASTPPRRAARPPAAWSWTSCRRRHRTPRREGHTHTHTHRLQDFWSCTVLNYRDTIDCLSASPL